MSEEINTEGLREVIQVVVIPDRLLGDETTGKLLERLRKVEGIKGIILQGPYYARRKIKVGDQSFETTVKVGKIFIEVEDESLMEEIAEVCRNVLPFGFYTHINRYYAKPVSEHLQKKPVVKDLGVIKRE
ncbi:MAG: Methyl coenzyme M reductase [Candidatus Alkanophagales archaeon MCA70_species_1]|nr:Methyl coenzyme M reductase [Candidatus Alkanophaga volatiphilum]